MTTKENRLFEPGGSRYDIREYSTIIRPIVPLINTDFVEAHLPARLTGCHITELARLTVFTPESDALELRSDALDLKQFRGHQYVVISWSDGSRAAVWAPDLKIKPQAYIRAYKIGREYLETYSWIAGGPEPDNDTQRWAAAYVRRAGGVAC